MQNSDKWIETMNGINHTISQCLKMENIGNVRKMVVYKTTPQCTNGYQCIKVIYQLLWVHFPRKVITVEMICYYHCHAMIPNSAIANQAWIVCGLLKWHTSLCYSIVIYLALYEEFHSIICSSTKEMEREVSVLCS